jgi:hypothetical protein
VVERVDEFAVDEGAGDGEEVAPEAAAPGCGVSFEFVAGVGDVSADGGVAGAVAGPVLAFGVFAGVFEVAGIPEADLGSAEG